MNKKAIIIAPRALYVCAPAFDAEPDDEGWYGHVITCTEKLDGGWYKIVTPYRYETYAHKDDMLFDKAEIARREGEDTKLLRVWALAGDVHFVFHSPAEAARQSMQTRAAVRMELRCVPGLERLE